MTTEYIKNWRLRQFGSKYYEATCGECGRVFNLLDATDAQESYYGHDCEQE